MKTRTWILGSASLLATLVAAPALAQTPPPVVQPAPQDPDSDAAVLDEVVVTGFRRSLESAQAIKQNSDQIIDSIVAEDIGKLPDVTASDSLARVTGVQVERGGGEAGRVLVRGLPDLTTTYNGRDIFTAESRFVAIQDFPAGGVAALDVYKSTSADLVEGGIAGLINVRSRRPFDFSGLEIAGAVRGTYAGQSEEYDPNANLLISNRWDTGMGEFGALLNVSYTQLRYLDSARFNGGGFIADINGGQVGGNTALIGARYPDAVGIFYGQGDRSRPSVNAAVQWRPSESLELYADFLYQGFHNEVSDRQLFVPLFGGVQFTNVVLQPNSNRVQSLTATNAVRPELFQGATENQTDTYQFAVGGSWTSGALRISADLAMTDSKYDSSIHSYDTNFASNPPVNVNFDVGEEEGGVEFDFGAFDTNNPANYIYRGFFDRRLVAEGDDVQFRTDLTWDTGGDIFTQVQAGIRVVDRNGSFRNGERYSYQEPLGLNPSQTPIDFRVIGGGFNGSNVQPVRTWVSPTYDSIRNNIAALRTLAGFAQGAPDFDPFQAFDANEKSYAAYGQVKFELDTAFPIDGVIGLRAVKTEESIDGTQRQFVDGQPPVFTPVTSESDYTDLLPSLSGRIHFSEKIQLRLTANKTRTRPNFNQLNPGLSIDPNIDPSSGRRNANGGNIDLQPIESTNYDASLEYYFSRTGFASLALFQRNVSGFIVNGPVDVDDPVLGPLRINRPINLTDRTLKGVEAAFTSFFDYAFLPDWAQGFGIQLNGTYIDADEDLPGISEFAYNVVGIYERGPVSTRLAWNSRSEYLNGCNTGFNPGCEYTDSVTRLDFSFNYTPVENVTVTFDASNILGEPFQSYREYQDGAGVVLGSFPRDVRFEESIYSLGVRFRY